MTDIFLAFLPQQHSWVEFFGFVLVNILTFVFGSILSILSYRAYNRRKNQTFKIATAGFIIITVGSITEAVYEIGIRRSFELTQQELIILHTSESLLLAIGLGLLFYSIIQK